MPRTAEIIAVGSELLTGGVTNTNARFLSELLTAAGVDVLYHTAVGDDEGASGGRRHRRAAAGGAAGIHRRPGPHLRRYDENGGVRRAGHAAGVPPGHHTGHPPLFRHRVPPGDARLQFAAGLSAPGLHRVPQPRGHRPRLRLYRRRRHRRAAARRSLGVPLSGGALPAALSGAAPRPGRSAPTTCASSA